jgi:hypothetical protein
VAQRIAQYRKHVTLRYKILPDRQFDARMARRTAVILVGNEADNAVLSRIGARLPIRVREREVLLGAAAVRGKNLGVTFIHPNPEAPERYLRVVGGTSPRAYELFEMLPTYLPDYLVFDEGMASTRVLPVLGASRSLVAGGYFDEHWRLTDPPTTVHPRPATRPATETGRRNPGRE